MLNEIEELEKKLTAARSPSSNVPEQPPIDVEGTMGADPLSYNPQKKIFHSKYEDVRQPNSKDGEKFLPQAAPGTVVGARAPDFSGYDALESHLQGLKPKDNSTQELINMGISTGIGALFGRVGAGAKVAGEYGLERAAHHEKRNESLEDMILKLKAARAQQLAKGAKGTKVGGGGSGAAELRKWVDDEDNVRLSQFQDKNGLWLRDAADPVNKPTPIQTRDLKKPDGAVEQVFTRGNQALPVGSQLAENSLQKNANGEVEGVNKRTLSASSLADHFNKTSAGLSPHADQAYKSISDKVQADPALRGIRGSYNDMVLGSTALGRGDVGNMKVAIKMLASALEKGRMTSDADVRQVSEMNLGLIPYFENKLSKATNGQEIEDVRREMDSAFGTINATIGDAYKRGVEPFNTRAKTLLGREHHDGLLFPGLPVYDRKKQTQLIDKSLHNAKETMSTGEWVQDLIVDGKPVLDGEGKPIKAVHIMRNGKPYALREATR